MLGSSQMGDSGILSLGDAYKTGGDAIQISRCRCYLKQKSGCSARNLTRPRSRLFATLKTVQLHDGFRSHGCQRDILERDVLEEMGEAF